MAKGLIFALLLVGCAAAKPSPSLPLTVLAVGESTTALGGADSWPAQMEGLLAGSCPGLRVRPWAVPGMDSAEAAARLPAGLSIHKPQVVIVMLGINDYEGVTGLVDGETQAFFRGDFADEAALEQALFRLQLERPWKDRRFVYLFARPYRDAGGMERQKAMLEQLRVKFPENPWVIAELGTIARAEGKLALAERLHFLAFGAALDEPHMLHEWLADFREEKTFEAARRKALRLVKNQRPADFVAASFYQAKGLRQKHEAVMRKIVRDGCATRKCLVMLKVALERNGKAKEAAAVEIPPFPELIAATRQNLKEIADEISPAQLFLMQYPLMPPSLLEGAKLGPVISNEENFRAALAERPFEDLFTDRFAGDFGHFRAPAARLVAESAAAYLLPWARAKGYCR
jgi:lysophospholipase L1-like esterase